jgi:hypothetical protein
LSVTVAPTKERGGLRSLPYDIRKKETERGRRDEKERQINGTK